MNAVPDISHTPGVNPPMSQIADAIYQEALTMKPEVQAEQLRLTASERQIDIARAGLYPTLSLNAGLQSNYYKTNGMPADPFATQLKPIYCEKLFLSWEEKLSEGMPLVV